MCEIWFAVNTPIPLGSKQTVFDAEVAGIEAAILWHRTGPYQHMTIHSDSMSATARAGHIAAGPGQTQAATIQGTVQDLVKSGHSASITWVKGHDGTPSNERADTLAGQAAEKTAWSGVTSLAYLRLRISEQFRTAKEAWHRDPAHHGILEIPPPPPKKSCLNKARNSLVRTAVQIRTSH